MDAPFIYHLAIERFRGIQTLSWRPAKGINIILGGGDVGKTTILDAVGLLLSPTNSTTLSDTDYYNRNIDNGFVIEAILALPPETGISTQTKPAWPWNWNGSEAVVPNTDGDAGSNTEPVYRLRVRGTADLDLAYN
jgi:putative ATP-dependent endonuclease of the OLD family